MKKIIAVILCIVSLFSFSGCSLLEEKVYEHGDFRYIFEVEKNGDKVVRILGLTEEAQKKETIVIPYKLKDYDIKYVGRYKIADSPIIGPHEVIDSIGGNYKYLYIQSDGIVEDKVIRSSREKTILINKRMGEKPNVDRELYGFKCNCTDEDHSINAISIFVANAFENMQGINNETQEIEPYFYDTWIAKANMIFEWNIEDLQKKYWIDNVVTGSRIIAPPEPTRKGYKFGGWYKEKECINKWNFDTDVTQTMIIEEGQKLTYEMQNQDDYATYLFAKWN